MRRVMAQVNLLSARIAPFHLAVGDLSVLLESVQQKYRDEQLNLIVRTGVACA